MLKLAAPILASLYEGSFCSGSVLGALIIANSHAISLSRAAQSWRRLTRVWRLRGWVGVP